MLRVRLICGNSGKNGVRGKMVSGLTFRYSLDPRIPVEPMPNYNPSEKLNKELTTNYI